MAKRLDPFRPVGKLAPTYGRDGFRIRKDGVVCLPTIDGKPGVPLAQVQADMSASTAHFDALAASEQARIDHLAKRMEIFAPLDGDPEAA